MIICQICQKECKSYFHLSMHLVKRSSDHISVKDYYDKFYLKNDNEKICNYRNCNNLVTFSSLENGYRKYCSPACCNREKIFDPEYNLNNSKMQIIAQNRPEVLKRSRESAINQWKDPDVRYRTLKTFKETASKPEVKKRMSDSSILKFQDPEFKEKYMAGRVVLWSDEVFRKKFKESHNTPEAKLNHSIATKNLWLDLDYRNKHISFHQNPERKKYMSDLLTSKILNGTWNPHHGNYKWGYFKSKKNANDIFYRSGTELKAFELLEKNDTVKSFEYEPFRIHYVDINGCEKFYIPDLLVIYDDGIKELIEIKPDVFLSDISVQLKLKSMKQYCINNNLKFRIWLESEIEKEIRDNSIIIEDLM